MISTSSDRDLGWLAGLLEGEGCFTVGSSSKKYPKKYPRIRLVMADEDVVRAAHKIAGVGTVVGPYSNENKGYNKKPLYRWEVSKQADVVGIMMTLYSMLGSRRQQRIREILLDWRTV